MPVLYKKHTRRVLFSEEKKMILKGKKKEILFTKLLSVLITVSLVLTSISELAFAMPMVSGNILPNMGMISSQDISANIIPFNVGRVTDADYNGEGKVLVTIQDLHSHKQTQENINSILKILDNKYGIRNIWLEGASGDLDTSWLANIKDENLKEKVMTALLNNGRLTGGELYSIQTGKTKILKGIENKDVYMKNFERLNEIYNKKEEIAEYLPNIRAILEAKIQQYYSLENSKIHNLRKKNRNGEIKADKYFLRVVRASMKADVNLQNYKQIVKYLYLLEYQKNLNFEKVNKQISNIIKELKETLNYKQYKELVGKVNNKETETEFYQDIKKYVQEKGLSGKYKEAEKFFDYISITESLNPIELAQEEEELIEETEQRFAKTGYEKDVIFLEKYFRLIESYLNNKITANEYKYFEKNREKFKELWTKYVDIDGIVEINKYFDVFDDFYKDNVERNRVFLKNITGKDFGKEKNAIVIKSAIDHKEKVSEQLKMQDGIDVIITGGFHTQGLSRLMEEEKINYVVITPNITEETMTSEKMYENMYREEYKITKEKFALMPTSEVIKNAIGKAIEGIDSITEIRVNDAGILEILSNEGTIQIGNAAEMEAEVKEKGIDLSQAKIAAQTFLDIQEYFQKLRANGRGANNDIKSLRDKIKDEIKYIEDKNLQESFSRKLGVDDGDGGTQLQADFVKRRLGAFARTPVGIAIAALFELVWVPVLGVFAPKKLIEFHTIEWTTQDQQKMGVRHARIIFAIDVAAFGISLILQPVAIAVVCTLITDWAVHTIHNLVANYFGWSWLQIGEKEKTTDIDTATMSRENFALYLTNLAKRLKSGERDYVLQEIEKLKEQHNLGDISVHDNYIQIGITGDAYSSNYVRVYDTGIEYYIFRVYNSEFDDATDSYPIYTIGEGFDTTAVAVWRSEDFFKLFKGNLGKATEFSKDYTKKLELQRNFDESLDPDRYDIKKKPLLEVEDAEIISILSPIFDEIFDNPEGEVAKSLGAKVIENRIYLLQNGQASIKDIYVDKKDGHQLKVVMENDFVTDANLISTAEFLARLDTSYYFSSNLAKHYDNERIKVLKNLIETAFSYDILSDEQKEKLNSLLKEVDRNFYFKNQFLSLKPAVTPKASGTKQVTGKENIKEAKTETSLGKDFDNLREAMNAFSNSEKVKTLKADIETAKKNNDSLLLAKLTTELANLPEMKKLEQAMDAMEILESDSDELNISRILELKKAFALHGYFVFSFDKNKEKVYSSYYNYREIDLTVFELQTKAGFGLLGLEKEPSFQNGNITPYAVKDGDSPLLSYDYLQQYNEAKNISRIVYMYLNGGLGESVKGREPFIFAFNNFNTALENAKANGDGEAISLLLKMARNNDIFGHYLKGNDFEILKRNGFIKINPLHFYDKDNKLKKEIFVNSNGETTLEETPDSKKISVPNLTGKASDTGFERIKDSFVAAMNEAKKSGDNEIINIINKLFEDGETLTKEEIEKLSKKVDLNFIATIMDIKMQEMNSHDGVGALQIVGPGGEENAIKTLSSIKSALKSELTETFSEGSVAIIPGETADKAGGLLLQERYYSWKKGANGGLCLDFDNINPGGHGTVFFTLFDSVVPQIEQILSNEKIDISKITREQVEYLIKKYGRELFFGNGDGLNSAPTGRVGAGTMTAVTATDVDSKGGKFMSLSVKFLSWINWFNQLFKNSKISDANITDDMVYDFAYLFERGNVSDKNEMDKNSFLKLFELYGLEKISKEEFKKLAEKAKEDGKQKDADIFENLIKLMDKYDIKGSDEVRLQPFNTNGIQFNNVLMGLILIGLKDILGLTKEEVYQLFASPTITSDKGSYQKFEWAIGQIFLWGNMNIEMLRKVSPELNNFMNIILGGENKQMATIAMANPKQREEAGFTPYKFVLDILKYLLSGHVENNKLILEGKTNVLGVTGLSAEYLWAAYYYWGYNKNEAKEFVPEGNIAANHLTFRGEKVQLKNKLSDFVEISPEYLAEHGYKFPMEDGNMVLENVTIVIDDTGISVEKDGVALLPEGTVSTTTTTTNIEPIITTLIQRANEWLQLTSVKILSIFKLKPTATMVVDANDAKAIEDAQALAESGIKVKMILLNSATESVTDETGKVVYSEGKEALIELAKKIGNLEIVTYEELTGKKADGKNAIRGILDDFRAGNNIGKENKNVLYVSSSLLEGQEDIIDEYVEDKTFLAVSTESINGALVKGLLNYEKLKVQALRDMTIQTTNIFGIYKADNVTEYAIEELKNSGIENIMIDVTPQDIRYSLEVDFSRGTSFIEPTLKTPEEAQADIDNAIKLAKDNGMNVIVFGEGAENIKQEGVYVAVKEQATGEQKQIMSYNEALDALKKGQKVDWSNVIVNILRDEKENIVLTSDNIKAIINMGTAIAFDGVILREISKEDTTENGITMLGLIKAMFVDTPEQKAAKIRARNIRAGRNLAVNELNKGTDLNKLIKNADFIWDLIENKEMGPLIVAGIPGNEQILAKLLDIDMESLTGREDELLGKIEGIMQVIELSKVIDNIKNIDKMDNIIADTLMRMLEEYRMLKGESYNPEIGDKAVKAKEGEKVTFEMIRDALQKDYDEAIGNKEARALAISGIINLLLTDTLQNDKALLERGIEAMDTKQIHALLSAA